MIPNTCPENVADFSTGLCALYACLLNVGWLCVRARILIQVTIYRNLYENTRPGKEWLTDMYGMVCHVRPIKLKLVSHLVSIG